MVSTAQTGYQNFGASPQQCLGCHSWKESFVRHEGMMGGAGEYVSPRRSVGPKECPAYTLTNGGLQQRLTMRWSHKHRGCL